MAHPELTTVTLDQYAQVLCATGEGASLEVALEAAAVSPRDWPAAEAQISAWIATARTDPGLLPAFDEAMRKAREVLARPVTPLDDDAGLWGRWLRAWSSAQDPIGMLDRSGMAMTDVVRLSTSWGERLREDRALAERFGAEMQGNAPAPEVRVGESPRLAAAKAALAAREKSESPPLDKPARPALFGALPGEPPPADTASPAAPPPAAEPPMVSTPPAQPSIVQSEGHDPSPEPRAVPSFMTARAPVSPPAPAQAVSPLAPAQAASQPVHKGLVTRPIPVQPAGGAPPQPLPFDPNARPEEMPSLGPQRQSGLTNDVDVSAIVRKVLAFGPQKTAEKPPAAAPSPAPVKPPVAPATPPVPTPPVAQAAPPIVPTLTIEQYASLCVDIESSPAHTTEILRRYGANEAGKRVLDEGWARLFSEQPVRRAAFENAKVAYRTWLSQGGRR